MAGRIPTPNPRIAFCPSFFDPHEPETMNDLDTFKFTTNPSVHDTWCLEAPHIFGHLVTAGHTALHEVTHLAFIMGAAIEAAVPGLAKEVVKEITGTLDINQADEDYLPAASRALKKTSQAYFDHLALPNKAGKQAPKEPPLAPIDHAESYAAAATEYYFWKMCGASFKPESVLAQDEAD
ncbi:hypothetical protein BT96DRAFT_922163 [Gymnopus androsaceus JB14]|uniref:Uncharacterized protein n=1 Tax=Gymnopus androsaceus JB14 TaxID=1447944 RepID=A0A6A4HFF0_9AGAR|nr:hypothetical protein BT96DRAFT_922163 [Gymnopus androsaceus JB14]